MKKNPLLIFLLLAVVCFFVQRQSASANYAYRQQKAVLNFASPSTFTDNTLRDNADSSVAAFFQGGDIAVTKTGPDTAQANTNITYTITVTSSGPDDVTGASLNDNLPPGTTFVSLSKPASWSCTDPGVGNNGPVNCTNSLVPAGANDVFSLTVHIDSEVPPGTFITNQAVVNGSPNDNTENDSSPATTLVPGTSADIGVTKTANVDSSLADRDVVYTITVTNAGPDAAASAALNDPLPGSGPSRMTFVSVSAPAGWSCTTPSPGATGTVNCTNPSLAVTGGQTFTLVGHIPPGTSAGTEYQNTVTVSTTTADPTAENNSASAGTVVFTCLTNPVVTTNANGGAGSLRQAIADACDGASIGFDMSQVVGPITLTTAELVIDKSLTILGPGATTLTVQRSTDGGTPAFRIFRINAGKTANISGLTISNGFDLLGGGILNGDGILNLDSSTISGNSKNGIANLGTNGTATTTITNSTINGNTSAASSGGGLRNFAQQNGATATLTVINSTISGNSATFGGGIVNETADSGMTARTTIINSTIAGNTGGGGIYNIAAPGSTTTTKLDNTIVAGNGPSGFDIGGTVDSNSSFNLIGSSANAGGLTNGVNNNKVGVADARLGPLAFNGGPTQTMALLSGSLALDGGSNTIATNATLTTDQRGAGFARVVDGPDADATATVDIGAFEAQVSVEDITDKTIDEDTQLQFTFNVGGAASITSVTAVSGNTALVPNNVANIAVSGSGSTRTLTINPLADKFGTSTITVTVNGNNSQSMTDTFVLTVNAVADTPSVTNATTNEDTQTTSGLVVTKNAVDGAEVTHFKITGITNGTLFKTNGSTQINNGDFITVAEGNAGLKFTPAANLFSPSTTFSFQVQGATSAGGTGLSSATTATITVNPVADTPSVTNATTTVNNQTTSGLVITVNPADGAEVTNFKITNITNGTLFKNNGTTQINNNDFITVAEGNAGLRFTPALNSNAAGSFQVQASLNNTNGGLGGSTATATITVNCGPTVVTSSNDSGAGSLRAIINSACPGSTISFDMSQVTSPITLATELAINKSLTISGPGASQLTISGNTVTRVFNVTVPSPGVVTFSDLTIANGKIGGVGGGILLNSTGTFNLNSSVLSGNVANFGGGIYNAGTGAVNISDSTFNNNSAPGSRGGGINMGGGAIKVSNSTFSFNSAGNGDGGGIYNAGVPVTITNSTFSNNSANGGTGGGLVTLGGTVILTNSTFSNNSAGSGGGILNFSATPVQLRNTILALNTATGTGPDGNGAFISNGHNLVGNNSAATITPAPGATGDLIGTNASPINPLLGALQNNGGPTQTRALLPGSPAINAGDNAAIANPPFGGPPFTDQRGTGFNRIVNTTVDIGAFESRGFTIAATNGTPQSATITTTFGAPLEATVSSAFSEPVAGGVLTFTAPASGPSGTFNGNVTTANFTIGASGMASPTFTANTQAGSYNVTAAANGVASSASFSLTNTKANTATTVTSSSNPSDLGQNVTFTATVTSVATPAGTVQFKIDGALAGGPVTLDAFGVATFTTASLTVGNHSIVADYSGNANFNPSTNSLPGSQVVRPSPSLSINDLSTTEGDSGTKTMNFTVTLSAASNQTVTVDFATVNGTAIAPADYQSASGTLTFTTGQTTKTIAVTIKGDQSFEPDEIFTVNLTNPANAVISKGQGTGTILNDDVQGGFISFSTGSYNVSESAGFVTLTVNRTNDTSGAATVDFATDDTGAPAACNTIGNLASARCDFTTAMGTVRFAAGETQKTFTILVNRDSFAENPELFTVNLSNLTGGAAFVAPSSATVTITNSPEGPANLIDDASFFVRQHYHDFLNREPDAGGLAFWTNQITSCGADAQCTDVKRVNVSAAFFLSIEFQETGGTVYLTSKAAFGVLPSYNRFERDSQALGRDYIFGAPGAAAVLEANKVAYFNEYVNRPDFVAIYGSLLNGPYVDTLIANTGVSFTQTERDALVNGLNNSTETRATVLRKITEKPSFRQAETNPMFVLMEYYGYLRRDPDIAGFKFWLNKLNQFNGNFVNADMVKAFITSGEYRGRFGP
jgi:hypothetical protein